MRPCVVCAANYNTDGHGDYLILFLLWRDILAILLVRWLHLLGGGCCGGGGGGVGLGDFAIFSLNRFDRLNVFDVLFNWLRGGARSVRFLIGFVLDKSKLVDGKFSFMMCVCV